MMEEQKVSAQDWTGAALHIPPSRLLEPQAEEHRRLTLAHASQTTRDLLYSVPDHCAIQTALSRVPLQGLRHEFTNELALQLSTGLQSTPSASQSETTQAALNFSLGLHSASLGATHADSIIPRASYHRNVLSNALNPLLPSLEPPNQLMMFNNEVIRTSLAQYLEEARSMDQLNAAIRLQGSSLNSFIPQLPSSSPFLTHAESISDTIQIFPYPDHALTQEPLRSDSSSTRVTLPRATTIPGATNTPISVVPGRLERSEVPPPQSTDTSIAPIDVNRILEQYLQQQQQARQNDRSNS
jgi:hypothetical protein